MATDRDAGGAPEAYRWTIGRAEFDEGRWQLSVGGQLAELERKPLEVLQYLLRHAGEAVTKEELLSAVWAGRVVVEAVLTNAVGKLRRALGEDAGAMIVTLPKVGYRLEGKVGRRAVEYIPLGSRLAAGDSVPRRSNWRLEETLARGGDGEVWLARHAKTGQVRVFKFSLDGQRLNGLKREVTVARLLEQALGPHRGFVRAIDWDFEQAPYFIEFEYGGASLDRWQDAQGQNVAALPLSARLALFCEAADAVAEAHGVGVLHKDLKPANLLLEGEPGTLQVRVTDFGSSRIFEPGLLEGLGITRLGLTQTQALSDSGTPLYLAPEVVAGQAPTVRSDVYALGVTLYQMVVGDFRRPLAPGWESDIADPLLRQDIADAANGDPGKRLESAALLAARIRDLSGRREKQALEDAVRDRIVQGEEKLKRLRARRPWMIAALMILGSALLLSGILLQRSRTAEQQAAEQRDKAQKQAMRAESVVKFLSNDLIGAVSPGGSAFEKDPTIRDLLGKVSTDLGGKFKDDPATQGSVHAALGVSWRTLGDRDKGEIHLRQAVQSYEQAFGDKDETTLRACYELVGMLAYAQKFDEATALLEDTDVLAGPQLAEDSLMTLRAAYLRGVLLTQRQKVAEAEPELRRADQLQRQLLPDDMQLASGIRVNLSDVYMRRDKLREAEELLKESLDDPRFDVATIGEVYLSALRLNLARALRNQGKYAEALPLAQAAQQASVRVMGENSWQALVQLSTIASILDGAGDCPSALAAMRRVHAGMVESFGEAKQGTLVEAGNLATKEYACGDRSVAMQLLRKVIGTLRSEHGPDNVHTQVYSFELAGMLADEQEYDEALVFLDGLDPAMLMAGDSTPGWEHRLNALRGKALILRGDKEQGKGLLAPALEKLDALNVDDAKELAGLRQLLRS
ncbi:protein kinase domain-containing protein [Stenotrophomonas sp. JC08]|uniref:protein kinase domain-containing protein n=1 Tax=Stenotrophomonas sp. JC08 TaxID=3445779 RepID=UPI003FA3068E